MTQNTRKSQKPEVVGAALADIAAGGEGWQVMHDPVTGQMKFVQRDDRQDRPQPGSVPVLSIAATGFASLT